MNARILTFPLASVLIATADACTGIAPTDPSVRLCHDDTTVVSVRFPDGSVAHNTVVWHDPAKGCRKAA